MLDTAKLTKVLMLTQSDADGEALAAIRRANIMLKSAGLNWEEFLRNRPKEDRAFHGAGGKKENQENKKGQRPEQEGQSRDGPKGIWKQNFKGNWVRYDTILGTITVFYDQRSGGFKWVNNGEFSEAFDTAEDAMVDFDDFN